MILLLLTAVLVLCIFLFCGNKGARAIVSTAMNAGLLLISLWLIYRGLSPVAVTLVCCVLITVVTLFYQNEPGIKSRAAFLSVLAVILIMVPVVFVLAYGANAEGFPPENYEMTDSNGYTRDIGIPMLSLQISVMFIALLGTVIDTAVAIVSSIHEIRASKKDLPLHALLESSFRVSKAVLSSSIHTIFYIYIAEYMTLFIQYVSESSFSEVLNSKSLAHELISISASGLGCCLVVPAATVIGALLIHSHGQEEA